MSAPAAPDVHTVIFPQQRRLVCIGKISPRGIEHLHVGFVDQRQRGRPLAVFFIICDHVIHDDFPKLLRGNAGVLRQGVQPSRVRPAVTGFKILRQNHVIAIIVHGTAKL